MNNKKENYFIDFLKFIFCICIVIYHGRVFSSNPNNVVFRYGYLAVDFYFIVTGYLMMNSIYKTNTNTIKFIYNKIKKLFPILLATFIIGSILVYDKELIEKPLILLLNLPELLQLGILDYPLSINCSCWYISAMIFTMLITYPLARRYKNNYIKYIAPLIIIGVYLFTIIMKININEPLETYYFVKNGLFKALIFIPLGNISYLITKEISKIKNNTNSLTIIEYLLYIIIILNLQFLFIPPIIHALLLLFSISLSFSNITYTNMIFNNSIWKKLARFGVYIYLCNTSIREFLLKNINNTNSSYIGTLLIFMLITLSISLVLYIIIETLYKKKK